MPRLSHIWQLWNNMGSDYMLFRAKHALRSRSGWYEKVFPLKPADNPGQSLGDWRSGLVLWNPESPNSHLADTEAGEALCHRMDRWKAGDWLFFSREWKALGKDYDWLTHPLTGYRYDAALHWSRVPDFDPGIGDIKYVWEPSRFSFVFDAVRYDAMFGGSHAEWVFGRMDSWMAANPVNGGPNWKCSQEISLRLFAWYLALVTWNHDPALTEERWQRYRHVMAWSLHHIYHHIDFSRKAVRNNHAITETLALYLGGLWFPAWPDAADWKRDGKKWFEEEVAYQVYEDGTFLQFSMNYHRAVVQLLSWALAWSGRYGERFDEVVYDRAYKSVNFLYQCQQTDSGWLPNYGHNDGALFFPWAQADFRDYRPALNGLHELLTGKPLYEIDGPWSEEARWLKSGGFKPGHAPAVLRQYGAVSFPVGGYYLVRDPHDDTLTFIRCGRHKDRPGQADNLHVDIWCGDQNVMADSGSYLYNTDAEWISYFAGSRGHNVLRIEDEDQMLKGPRFVWWHWTQAEEASFAETAEAWIFTGVISAFRQWDDKCRVRRTVVKQKGVSEWIVTDEVLGPRVPSRIEQWWHPAAGLMEWELLEDDKPGTVERREVKGWRSDYYGTKQPAPVWVLAGSGRTIRSHWRLKPIFATGQTGGIPNTDGYFA